MKFMSLGIALIGIGAFTFVVSSTLYASFSYAATGTGAQCPHLTQTLQLGSRDASTGGEVTKLQRYLAEYYNLDSATYVTGYFGELTRQNVRRFQCEQLSICSGTESSTGYGVVGAQTRAKIAANCTAPKTTDDTSSTGGSCVSHWTKVLTCAEEGYLVNEGSVVYDVKKDCKTGVETKTLISNTCGLLNRGAEASCTFNGQTVSHGSVVLAYAAKRVPAGYRCLSELRACLNGKLTGSNPHATCETEVPYLMPPPGSCMFNGTIVTSGTSVFAFASSQVSFGQSCVSQQRVCTDGVLSGTYQYARCSVINNNLVTDPNSL